jgi:hypothetical protein
MGANATEAPDYFADASGYATHEVLNQAGADFRTDPWEMVFRAVSSLSLAALSGLPLAG